ncbi:UNVERIFIED_CONTAM: ATP-binding cassette domain-containing protein [Campylobacter lari]
MKIKLNNVYINYGKQKILENINLEFHSGLFYGIYGKSGSGKTTLLKALLNPQLIEKGFIAFDDKIVCNKNKDFNQKAYKKELKENLKIFRKLTGFVFQETSLIESYDVYDNIRLKAENCFKNNFYAFFKIFSKENKTQIANILNLLELEDKIFTPVNMLSGGQKHKVEIASFLLNNKRIILADEPTTGLDTKNAKLVFKLLKEYAKNNDAIVISTIHDIDNSLEFIEKAFFIKEYKVHNNIKFNDLSKEEIDDLYN